MQAGTYSPGPVVSATVRVLVAGVERPVESIEWAADTTGGLPDQVVSAGTGMRSRTGTVRWGQEDVQVDPPHPLRRASGWPPRQGDAVVVEATVAGVTWRRFTGRIASTTGSLTAGTLSSKITDMLGDALSVPVSIEPTVGVHQARSIWTAHGAIEAAGLGLLPPWNEDGVVLAFHGQGGAAPVVGTGNSQFSYGVDWGNAGYYPTSESRGARAALALARGGVGEPRTEITLVTTQATLVLGFELATRALDLSVGGSRVWTGTLGETGDIPLLGLLISPSGAEIRVFTSLHSYVTVPASIPSGWAVTKMSCQTGRVASMQVRYIAAAEAASIVARTPAMLPTIQRSALEQVRIPATRGVQNVAARQIVDEWSEATLGSVWMDEYGRLQMVARDRLLERSPSRVVQVGERVFAGSWSIGHDSVYSGVVVKGLRATVSTGPGLRTVLYQPGNVQAIDPGEPLEQIVSVPDHEDWIDLDTNWRPVRNAREGIVNDAAFAARDGSFWQIVFADPSDMDRYRWTGAGFEVMSARIERLGQRAVKITHQITNTTAKLKYYLASPSAAINYPLQYQGVPMPILRGRALVSWTEYTATAGGGPSWAPTLVLDSGWWLTPADAQRVADALAAEVTRPMPTLSGVKVLWDPTRQIGDVEDWTATAADGSVAWTARVLVTGYSESWDGRVPSQTVDVRVMSMTDPTTGKTYGDLAAAYSTHGAMTGTYQQTYDALPGRV